MSYKNTIGDTIRLKEYYLYIYSKSGFCLTVYDYLVGGNVAKPISIFTRACFTKSLSFRATAVLKALIFHGFSYSDRTNYFNVMLM